MASKYVVDLGPVINASTITETAAAVQTKAMTVSFNDGLSIAEQIDTLEQIKDYIVQHGAEDGAAADL